MSIPRKSLLCFVFACAALLFGVAPRAGAQDPAGQSSSGPNPCETGTPSRNALPETGMLLDAADSAGSMDTPAPIQTQGLTPVDRDLIVYDSNQGICWLADANLAGNALIRQQMGVAGVTPDGVMDYATALKWVDALNKFDNGRGFLGHNNWQLPDNPLDDPTCSSANHASFGAFCTGSALGNLYYVGLGIPFPDSVDFLVSKVSPFRNLQPGYYWTQDNNSGGEVTTSFINTVQAANTLKYNYFHVLPMTTVPIGTPPAGSGVLPYTAGEAAGKAVYDTNTGITWTLDADLAAHNNFGVTGTTTITSETNGTVATVPLIDADGAMLYPTAIDSVNGWLAALNNANYAGTNLWTMPHLADLQTLAQDINLQRNNDSRLVAQGRVGPFLHLQPFMYWSCVRDQNGDSRSPCDPNLSAYSPPGTLFEYSFTLNNGFEGTSLAGKQFYVMVYYPAPSH
jgi:hypothetical protein